MPWPAQLRFALTSPGDLPWRRPEEALVVLVTVTRNRRRFGVVSRTSVPLLILAFMSGCGGAASSTSSMSISERNTAAKPAVAYDSGAELVGALEQAGSPCVTQRVTPQEAAATYVADIVMCTYAADDWLQVFMAAPSEPGRAYYSMYFESSQEAKTSVSATSLTLEGNLWFATAPTDERLFTTQGALGGQLLEP
jgi:hypothetical protein